jgi:hypothetical protein
MGVEGGFLLPNHDPKHMHHVICYSGLGQSGGMCNSWGGDRLGRITSSKILWVQVCTLCRVKTICIAAIIPSRSSHVICFGPLVLLCFFPPPTIGLA